MNLPLPFQTQREQAQEKLMNAVGQGHLDLETYSELVGTVWSANDLATIDQVVQSVALAPKRATPTIKSKQLALFSSKKVKGALQFADKSDVVSAFATVKLDLRKASISSAKTTLNIVCLFGEVELIVPKGVQVHSEVFSLFSEEKIRATEVSEVPGPIFYLQGVNLFGSVKVTTA